jgi:hypothetical protein
MQTAFLYLIHKSTLNGLNSSFGEIQEYFVHRISLLYLFRTQSKKKKKENEIVLVLFTFTKTIRVTNSYDFPFYAWKECFKNSSFNFYNISIEKNLESSLGCSKGEQASD